MKKPSIRQQVSLSDEERHLYGEIKRLSVNSSSARDIANKNLTEGMPVTKLRKVCAKICGAVIND